MKNMKKLIPALAMLLISAVMMSTASFAWFSMSNQVTVSSMQVTAKTSGGIYQSAPVATKAWKTDEISASINATVLPTVVTRTEESFAFVGNISNQADDYKGDNTAENVALTTAASPTDDYSGTFGLTAAGTGVIASQYASGDVVAVYLHFWLAVDGDAAKTLTAKMTVSAENDSTIADAVEIAMWVGTEADGKVGAAQAVTATGTLGGDTEQTLTSTAPVRTVNDGGTEVWIVMYINGDSTSCTVAAADLNNLAETVNFEFTAN